MTTPGNDPKTTGRKGESWWDIVKFALITLAIVIPIRLYVAQPFIVSGDSMFPTFKNGEYLIVDELSYNFHTPRRGDVVIFRPPTEPNKYYIKRVIGLPGETVTVSAGQVFITSEGGERIALDEPYLKTETGRSVSTKVGTDQYFVMGDNRPVSFDSRYWGPVKSDAIRGRAFVRLFPPTKLSYLPGNFKNYNDTTSIAQ